MVGTWSSPPCIKFCIRVVHVVSAFKSLIARGCARQIYFLAIVNPFALTEKGRILILVPNSAFLFARLSIASVSLSAVSSTFVRAVACVASQLPSTAPYKYLPRTLPMLVSVNPVITSFSSFSAFQSVSASFACSLKSKATLFWLIFPFNATPCCFINSSLTCITASLSVPINSLSGNSPRYSLYSLSSHCSCVKPWVVSIVVYIVYLPNICRNPPPGLTVGGSPPPSLLATFLNVGADGDAGFFSFSFCFISLSIASLTSLSIFVLISSGV